MLRLTKGVEVDIMAMVIGKVWSVAKSLPGVVASMAAIAAMMVVSK